MTKFTIVTYIKNDKIESKAFSRENSTDAVELFERVRAEGCEAYLFHRPLPTKHCKSQNAREATKAATYVKEDAQPTIIEKIVSKVGRKPKSAVQAQTVETKQENQSDAVDLP